MSRPITPDDIYLWTRTMERSIILGIREIKQAGMKRHRANLLQGVEFVQCPPGSCSPDWETWLAAMTPIFDRALAKLRKSGDVIWHSAARQYGERYCGVEAGCEDPTCIHARRGVWGADL